MKNLILEENESSNYKPRTEENAKNADLTIAIALDFKTAGEVLTKELVDKHGKKFIAVRPEGDPVEKASKIVDKINSFDLPEQITLNIAGNGLYTMRGALNQTQADEFAYLLLKNIVHDGRLKSKITKVRTGGQTGFDEAGAKAALKLGIWTTVHMPKGFRIRNEKEGEITMSAEHARLRFEYVPTKTKVFVDMDNCLCDFVKSYNEWKKAHPQITYPQSQFGFFSNLEPVDGAVEAFKKLQDHFDVYILTRPSIYNLMCYTEKADWVKRHLGFEVLEKLIIACDKSMVRAKGAYLIDDDTQAGQLEFEGEFVHFKTDKFPDWNSVLNYLIK